MHSRRLAGLIVLLLCALTLVLKHWANAPRTSAGYGDVAYYFTVARNLAEGRGFVTDYVPEYLSHPSAIPTAANTYWMPLVSIVCALGMVCFGATYAVAQGTMIAVTSLAPLLTYLLAREIFRNPDGGLGEPIEPWPLAERVGLAAAALATAFHPFLTPASQPVTSGLVLVIGATFLWMCMRALRDVRAFAWLGPLIALALLNRSDGILYFAPALVVLLARTDRSSPWGPIGRALLGFALLMTPFWIHSWVTTGYPMPTGPGRAAFLLDYRELYSLPESLTLERYLDAGWGELGAQKWRAVKTNADAFWRGLYEAQTLGDAHSRGPGLGILFALCVAGLVWFRRRALLPVAALLVSGFVLYSFVFALTGPASWRAMLFAVYPVALVGAARTLLGVGELGGRLLGAPGQRMKGAFVGGLLLAIGWAGFGEASTHMRGAGDWINKMRYVHWRTRTELIEPMGLQDEVFVTESVHQVHANTGLKLISLPFEDEPRVRATARRFGANYVLLFGRPELSGWQTLVEITRGGEYELLAARDFGRERVRLFRIPESTRRFDRGIARGGAILRERSR